MFTLDELIANTVNNATGVERLGIAPRNWWSEALHGVSTSPGVTFASNSSQPFSSATDFPNGISLGASFDDEMVYNVGNIIKKEVRAFNNAGRSGINLYSPANINAFRDPRWGRGQETPGEDLLHISNFARAIVKGVQGEDPTKIDALLCAKHFVAYE
jgi:xylan 1,4-beta-xylosidase